VTDAVIIAILGAVFNAGVIYGTMRGVIWRLKHNEEETARAHVRLDHHLERRTRGK
jgi:hypothetical protein